MTLTEAQQPNRTVQNAIGKLLGSQTLWLVLISVAVLAGLNLTLMDVDASQYASISREMAETDNWLQVTNRNQPYLDKPPLLFWLSALSIKLIGPYAFAYRLPTVLAVIIAAFSAKQLAQQYYGKQTGLFAWYMTVASQAIFLTMHDCRTDTILMAAVIFSMNQLSQYLKTEKWLHFYGAFIGMGCALLAKGPIGAVVPIVAFSLDWALKRQWKNFFRWEWLSGLVIVALMLAPMTYGLYKQWGMHGVRFYYWTQSFGRITGESEWDNGADFSFLFTNLLWSLLPWTPWFLLGIWFAAKQLIDQKFKLGVHQEALTSFGVLIPLLMLSTSKYQLPHYSYVLLGLIAIQAAAIFNQFATNNWAQQLQKWFSCLLIAVVGLIGILLGLMNNSYLLAITCGTVAGLLVYTWLKTGTDAITSFGKLACSIALANVLLNTLLYPAIMPWQAPTTAIRFLKDQQVSLNQYRTFNFESHAADFYAQRTIPNLVTAQQLKDSLAIDQTYYLLIRKADYPSLDTAGLVYEEVKPLYHYHITKLTLPFLMPSTRDSVSVPCAIVKTTRVGLAYNQHVRPYFQAVRPN